MKRKIFYLCVLVCGASLFSSAGKISDSCASVEAATVNQTAPVSTASSEVELGTITITQFF